MIQQVKVVKFMLLRFTEVMEVTTALPVKIISFSLFKAS